MKSLLFLLAVLAFLPSPAAGQSLQLTLDRTITYNYAHNHGTVGCTYDLGSRLFHVAYFPLGLVYSFDWKGKMVNTMVTSGFPVKAPSPNGITWNPVDGNLYLVDNRHPMNVVACTPGGKFVGGWSCALTHISVNPVGIAYNRDAGTLFVCNHGKTPRESCLTEWTPGGAQVVSGTVNTLSRLNGVAHVPQTGRFLLTSDEGTADKLYEVDGRGRLLSTTDLSRFGVKNTQEVDYEPESGVLTVVCNKTLTLFVFRYRPGGLVTFGGNCPGSGGWLPARRWSGTLATGGRATLTLERVLGNTTAFHVLGHSRSRFLGLPLPIALDAYGAPGCPLNVDLLHLTGRSTFGFGPGNGIAQTVLAIPRDPALVGATLYDQWLLADPAANPLGLVASPGGILFIAR